MSGSVGRGRAPSSVKFALREIFPLFDIEIASVSARGKLRVSSNAFSFCLPASYGGAVFDWGHETVRGKPTHGTSRPAKDVPSWEF
jgi:hypothetical protein